ncbi:cytochrome c-type biogenesis protein [Aquimonas sp.]|uniref:cytochrome c-type biogenesis protein n=1 Tax=Aquimonas sp. TaxID=1872588 RepID=UPI0037BF0B82
MTRILAGLLGLLISLAALAIDPLPFRDQAEQDRFRKLAAQLRCVMCQNQSLADSDAMIAQDLRREVFQLMQDGKTDQEIKDFLAERYTNFVLYNPPLDARNALLWLSPVALLLIGGITVFVIVRKRSAALKNPAPDNDEEW